MSEHEQQTPVMEAATRRRSAAERFAHLGDRLTRNLGPNGRTSGPGTRAGAGQLRMTDRRVDDDWPEVIEEPDYSENDQPTEWYEVVPRFAIVRSGYDCAAVDEHVAALEHELAELDQELIELRARTPAHDEVAAELSRVGEETSSILLAAHDRARETTRQAQEQADRCLADAAAAATAMKEEEARERDAIRQDIGRLTGERTRLLSDLEGVAAHLGSVAREARERSFGQPG